MRRKIVPILLLVFSGASAQAAAPLSALDAFVVSHGFGGAQFVRYQNTFRLPIKSQSESSL